MKRIASLFLAALMVAGMTALTACDSKDPAGTSGSSDGATSGSGATTTASTTGDSGTTQATTTGSTVDDPPLIGGEDLILVSPGASFHYKVFECIYSGTGAGGEYTTDALKDYMDRFGWDLGADTIPQEALEDIFTWDEANGPFGWDNGDKPLERAAGLDLDGNEHYNNDDIGWAGDNHGLICATTFTIDNLEEFKKTYSELSISFWYDNTPSVYLNGELVFYVNTELTGNPGDWVDNFNYVYDEDLCIDDTLMDHLVQGENTIVIVMKDAWGGRECCFELDAFA